MNFEDIKLQPGYPLQLQTTSTEGQAKRLNCRYVGALTGKYLLVTHPAGVRLRGGQKLAVRAMVANGIALFPVQVETILTAPSAMLCLSFPASVKLQAIRGATRVTVDLPLTALNRSSLEEISVQGKLADLSISGAKVELAEVAGEVGDRLQLTTPVQIGPLQRELQLNATIRARTDRSLGELDAEFPAVYGVEFVDLDDENLLLLHAYVYYQMAGH